mmetsp:Transcript_36108/g.60873  ORF Transcript_36108/g.60873 Transcript_36108/m.60873 type:complete len:951 (-) Transcript_36108:246-3098(-)|eukprot:CAMPEP_0198211012 /NCGR_PEP_ID=MMETSP1445-20131203/22569_1 /TAXON_ID=36898 /ORGANISM="Pyramimonas sp., Strain CCMP2087" /LENGTH=950 /DNA_ID=CAMNT_0043885191 /DNA_START=143 /DNA_END=2995 /DNA_ORIENTATION=-
MRTHSAYTLVFSLVASTYTLMLNADTPDFSISQLDLSLSKDEAAALPFWQDLPLAKGYLAKRASQCDLPTAPLRVSPVYETLQEFSAAPFLEDPLHSCMLEDVRVTIPPRGTKVRRPPPKVTARKVGDGCWTQCSASETGVPGFTPLFTLNCTHSKARRRGLLQDNDSKCTHRYPFGFIIPYNDWTTRAHTFENMWHTLIDGMLPLYDTVIRHNNGTFFPGLQPLLFSEFENVDFPVYRKMVRSLSAGFRQGKAEKGSHHWQFWPLIERLFDNPFLFSSSAEFSKPRPVVLCFDKAIYGVEPRATYQTFTTTFGPWNGNSDAMLRHFGSSFLHKLFTDSSAYLTRRFNNCERLSSADEAQYVVYSHRARADPKLPRLRVLEERADLAVQKVVRDVAQMYNLSLVVTAIDFLSVEEMVRLMAKTKLLIVPEGSTEAGSILMPNMGTVFQLRSHCGGTHSWYSAAKHHARIEIWQTPIFAPDQVRVSALEDGLGVFQASLYSFNDYGRLRVALHSAFKRASQSATRGKFAYVGDRYAAPSPLVWKNLSQYFPTSFQDLSKSNSPFPTVVGLKKLDPTVASMVATCLKLDKEMREAHAPGSLWTDQAYSNDYRHTLSVHVSDLFCMCLFVSVALILYCVRSRGSGYRGVRRPLNSLLSKWTVAFQVIFSLSSSVPCIVINKYLMSTLGFRHSTTLVFFHLLSTTFFSSFAGKMGLFEVKKLPFVISLKFGILNMLSITVLNFSLLLNSVGVYQLGKLAVIPCTIGLQRVLYGKTTTLPMNLSLASITVGLGIVTVTDVVASLLGFVALCAAIMLQTYAQLQPQRLKQEYGVNGIQILHQSVWISTSLTFCAASPLDYALLGADLRDLLPAMNMAFEWILLSCFFAVLVNAATIVILAELGAVTNQVVGHLKTCIILLSGYTIFGAELTAPQVVGMGFSLVGILAFAHFDIHKT